MILIFDFDGTLVNSIDKVILNFNILADQFGFRKIHQTEISELKNLSSRELVRHLKIPLYKMPFILPQARQLMQREIPTLQSFEGLPEVLQSLHNHFTLGIITSNTDDNVKSWLKLNKLDHLFTFIHAGTSIFGKSDVLKAVLTQGKYKQAEVTYIGDETRDIDAAKANGIQSIAVTWGFNSETILLQQQPHHIVRTPNELLLVFSTFT